MSSLNAFSCFRIFSMVFNVSYIVIYHLTLLKSQCLILFEMISLYIQLCSDSTLHPHPRSLISHSESTPICLIHIHVSVTFIFRLTEPIPSYYHPYNTIILLDYPFHIFLWTVYTGRSRFVFGSFIQMHTYTQTSTHNKVQWPIEKNGWKIFREIFLNNNKHKLKSYRALHTWKTLN